ncbi:MAG: DUF222 domain-containing protein [Microbacterium sp.]|uniref:HNH endonuclease signature motif containing protein n=1 Tax=Microbacterium sp. TaxID=51671 RepID=UPI0039E5440E
MGSVRTAGADTAEVDALVCELEAAHRAIAAAQAWESKVLARAAEVVVARTERAHARAEEALRRGDRHVPDADMPLREMSAELSAALRLCDRAVQRRMGDAWSMAEKFPSTLAAWERGEIDAGHAAAVLAAGRDLPASLRAGYEDRILEVARFESANRLRSIAPAIAARIDPVGAAERIAERRADRDVWVRNLGDDMARLTADLPATLAHAIVDRLTEMAHRVQGTDEDGDRAGAADPGDGAAAADGRSGSGAEAEYPATPTLTTTPRGFEPDGGACVDGDADTRRIGQVRADLLADLLLAGAPVAHGDGIDAITGHVQVTVPALSLAGVGSTPALLAGSGPMDLETARRLAHGAPGWDRVLTDPYTGAVLAVDRYRPNADLGRFLRARDERCRFPGCVRPARGCDVDHNEDAALGGATCDHNLCHLCRRHHSLKHATPWRVRQRRGGVIEWTSPVGRRYVDRPPATVRFVPDPDAAPKPDPEPPPFSPPFPF